ncbi:MULTISPECIES: sigma-70 family RNA polymerase sigma factor [unclassified Micromonospora]|uniref:sigma-70 family RNA polymerase sigma factor n=1 Tax=Micromonospora TaxID=1873 RepID=UPI001EE7DFFE|nr:MULTISPECIES: sigma-70 family RNA polymerase sigma factor [Micromonospora]MCG5449602.1 sigma-70 family RNA polymerase sigma factor [Micromonospora hortensis]MCX5115599.1 sigma-70 family RNA polymerase sigma factor [Micromonospora sp. NBC_00362]WTI06074.1 sigma-70 family RNA polymerase sigma factor [Micromonospora sp. NBC_00821]
MPRMSGDPEQGRRLRSVPPDTATPPNADELLPRVARGDEAAFATLYDAMAGRVLGLARRVVRDPAQAEEVTQEVMVEVWRTAGRFDAGRGSASAWILTMAHRRAVDRVRSEQAHINRTQQVAATEAHVPYDEVVEDVTARLEREQVRRCLGRLTPVQRESVTLAYYGGHTYREVAEKLQTPLPTVKTRMRDGLIRMRDCLGIEMEGRA